MTPSPLRKLPPISQLRALELHGCPDPGMLWPLAGIVSLRKLTLSSCGPPRLELVSALTGLAELHIFDCEGISTLTPLASLVRLHALTVNSTELVGLSVLSV